MRKLAGAAVAALLAGCAPAQGAAADVTGNDLETLRVAEQVLLRECMAEAGFEYRITPKEMEIPQFPYVVDDPAWAAEHGYGSDIDALVEHLREDDPNQRYFRGLPAERRAQALRAANGASPDGLTAHGPDGITATRSASGCQSAAQRRLYGDLAAWFQATTVVSQLPQLRAERVLADPRYAAAVQPWSVCMGERSHPFPTPQAARAAAAGLDRSAEIALARAEAACADSSGLSAAAHRLDTEYGTALDQQYRSDIDTVRRLRLGALPRARDAAARA